MILPIDLHLALASLPDMTRGLLINILLKIGRAHV